MFKSLLLVLCTVLTYSLSAQIYVDIDANGTADGSTWTNAYNDIETAINNATEGDEIWIAEGNYLCPGTNATSDNFLEINVDMKIYGGFAGTESSVDDRDPAEHIVVFDADQNGDDVAGEGQTNRDDNNRHVLFIADNITNNTVIDGITLKGGTTEPATGADDGRRGGGILTYGAPIINNCILTENYGHFGGGIYPRGATADGSIITNSDFINNYGTFGVGMYLLAEVTLEDLHFEGNSGSGRGIGMYIGGENNTLLNCTFKDNTSFGSSAGALQLRTFNNEDSITVNVINCEFDGNSGTFGGAVASYDSLSTMVFEDCFFRNNMAINVGGASTNAFGARSTFNNCVFDSNSSGGSGGANYSQNDDAIITIQNCQYFNNTAEFGGVLSTASDEEGDFLPILNINGADMFLNSASEQAPGINTVNTNATLVNVMLTNNFSSGTDVIGGAMSINVTDSITTSVSIINSTFADNSANLISGIASWEGGPSAKSTVTLQNVLLSNIGGDNYGIEDGEPELISNGGNLSTDNSALDALTGMNDFNNEDINFVVGPGDLEFYPDENSSAINNGIAEGAPLLDLNGNERIGPLDIGALENQDVVNVSDYLASKTKIEIIQNPIIGNALNFEISSPFIGDITIDIIDANGKQVHNSTIYKFAETQVHRIENLEVNHGVYFLNITDDISNSTSSFISIK